MAGSTAANQTQLGRAFWCCFFGGGIIGTLLVYGLLQERIMAQSYGDDRFTVSAFLVWCNRVVAVAVSVCVAYFKSEPMAPQCELWKYLAVSLSNVAATWCQYEALLYVSFPVQMLGKSFKMMPVMVWGIIISQKVYGFRDWMIAIAVTGGVTEFLCTGPTAAEDAIGNETKGFILLICYLASDGFTSTMQEKLFREHKMTKYNQMMYVNIFSAVVSFLTVVCMGDTVEAFTFGAKHPAFITDCMVLSASAVAGQLFILSMVKEFGALVFAATMNVRQVISILMSYATYGTPITGLQVLGLICVFSALFYKSIVEGMESGGKGERQPLMKDVPKANSGAVKEGSEKAADK